MKCSFNERIHINVKKIKLEVHGFHKISKWGKNERKAEIHVWKFLQRTLVLVSFGAIVSETQEQLWIKVCVIWKYP